MKGSPEKKTAVGQFLPIFLLKPLIVVFQTCFLVYLLKLLYLDFENCFLIQLQKYSLVLGK